jgi:hypothetical protein
MVTSVHFSCDSEATKTETKPGYVETHVDLGNPIFIFCCSLLDADQGYLKQQFGSHIVRIHKPRRFTEDISTFLESLPYKFAGGIEGCIVKYNKGRIIQTALGSVDRTRLSYAQKPADFRREKEYRLVSIIGGSPINRFNDDYITVDIGGALDYVELLD